MGTAAKIACLAAGAQQVMILRDGTQLYGAITGARDRNGELHALDTVRIDTIQFAHPEKSGGISANPSGNNAGNNYAESGGYSQATGRNYGPGNGARSYAAQVTQDVVDGVLALDLQSVSVDGRRYVVRVPAVPVPAETILNFRLDNPVALRPGQ